jgi:hypothetical protein
MKESDYAQTYPSTQFRTVVKLLDNAYLKLVGYISGTFPPVINANNVNAIIKTIQEEYNKLPKDYRPFITLSFHSDSTTYLNGYYFCLSMFVNHRHSGKTQNSKVKVIIPVHNNDFFVRHQIFFPNSF